MATPAPAKWPQLSDFQEAMEEPRLCFQDPELQRSQPKRDPLGFPRIITGNFAGVCELRSGTQRWAVRFFWRQVSDQQRRYNIISQHLGNLKSQVFVDFQYKREGIRVHGKWYPIVIMEWVEGEPLSVFIEQRLGDPATLLSLAQQWRGLVIPLLRGLHVAHGDLQHGNVLVTPSSQIKLVDYDGMFVLPLKGEKSPELGHPNYAHPKRTPNNYDETLDNFPALVIYLSLVALANEPGLWRQFYTGENLILSAPDYKNPRQSAVMQRLKNSRDPYVKYLADCLERYCQGLLSQVPDLETVLSGAPAPASKPIHSSTPIASAPVSAPPQAQTSTSSPVSLQDATTNSVPWWQPAHTPSRHPHTVPPPNSSARSSSATRQGHAQIYFIEKNEIGFPDLEVNCGIKRESVTYANKGSGSLSGTVTTDAPQLLQVSPTALTQNSGDVEVSLDTGQLTWGRSYSQNVIINYNGADSPKKIPVRFRVKDSKVVIDAFNGLAKATLITSVFLGFVTEFMLGSLGVYVTFVEYLTIPLAAVLLTGLAVLALRWHSVRFLTQNGINGKSQAVVWARILAPSAICLGIFSLFTLTEQDPGSLVAVPKAPLATPARPSSGTAAPTLPPPPSASTAPTLRPLTSIESNLLYKIRNATLNMKDCGEKGIVKLKNGFFEEPYIRDDGKTSYSCQLWMDDVFAIGNLNRDGVDDAAIVVYSTGGGSGIFFEHHLLVQNKGRFVDVRSFELGDRVIIHSLSIETGEVLVDITSHGPDDPRCCPTNRQMQRYSLESTPIDPSELSSTPAQPIPQPLSSDTAAPNLPSPLPQSGTQWAEGEHHVYDMLVYASINGGIDYEAQILEKRRSLEALNVKPPSGDSKKARGFNDRGRALIQNSQVADAVQAFEEAYRTNPADAEIVNNLGYAYMKNGNLDAAEQFLYQALVLSPARSNAWANLGQIYAEQGNLAASVAGFANAYRFSRNQDATRRFLQGLVDKEDSKVQEAVKQTLQLKLVQAGRNDTPALSDQPPTGAAVSSATQAVEFSPGVYKVVRETTLRRSPGDDADIITQLHKGMKVHVVRTAGVGWLRIESSHTDRPPGYLRPEDIVAIEEKQNQKVQ
jgi:Flp pilus assembly protein TadD